MYRALSFVLLLPLVAMAQNTPDLDELLEKQTFESGDKTLSYRLLKPAKVDPKESYPLVIFLHGAGERGDDNAAQLKYGVGEFAKPATRKKHPCFLVAPQCPKNGSWGGTLKSKAFRTSAAPLVVGVVEKLCKELPIDKKRVYVTGLSMGGFGTWGLLASHPELFAAGVPICGGGEVKTAEKFAKIPVWAFHGDKDNLVKVDLSRTMIAALKKAGGSPKYTEYPGVDHDSWTRTYRNPEVIDWLFAQKKE